MDLRGHKQGPNPCSFSQGSDLHKSSLEFQPDSFEKLGTCSRRMRGPLDAPNSTPNIIANDAHNKGGLNCTYLDEVLNMPSWLSHEEKRANNLKPNVSSVGK
ncbi:hypothetical protein ACFE04_022698 [Oxalis oulophora]